MTVNMTLECHIFILWILIWILSYQEQECCRFGQGSNCGFPCRCTGANLCDPDSGDCIEGSHCQSVLPDGYGWQGQGCRIGNVAYGKLNVHQSGIYSYYIAQLAVDGVTNPYINNEPGQSCAHPLTSEPYAWWWVDLGDIYTIQSVTLVNRLTPPGHVNRDALFRDRSTDFDIKIGNTSDRSQQALCFGQDKPGNEVHPVETMSCDSGEMVGRYVSFTRTGGIDPDQAAICELIVMGYKTIECHPNDCIGACDSMIGCDQCVSGKMLPDCMNVCPDGYWGVNCANICGHCKDGVVCNKLTGSCGNHCYAWYIPHLCTEELVLPPETLNLELSDITSDSAMISWDRSADFQTVILQYFYYVVEYRRNDDNMADWHPSNRILLSTERSFRYELLGLAYNTEFVLHIVPYRDINGQKEQGSIETIEIKTLCKAPEIPPIPSIDGTPDKFTVTWRSIASLSSGCDEIQSIAVARTCENSTHTIINETYEISITITSLVFEISNAMSCSVVLFVTNNAGLTSGSANTIIFTTTVTNSLTTEVATVKTNEAPTSKQKIKESRPNIPAIIVGAVLGVVVIILVVVIVVLVLRKRREIPSASGAKPDTDTSGNGKPNPVYENKKNSENDMESNINPLAVYESVDGMNKTDNKVTTQETPNVVYENTHTTGPESQYASLDHAHRNTPQTPSVYQELKQ